MSNILLSDSTPRQFNTNITTATEESLINNSGYHNNLLLNSGIPETNSGYILKHYDWIKVNAFNNGERYRVRLEGELRGASQSEWYLNYRTKEGYLTLVWLSATDKISNNVWETTFTANIRGELSGQSYLYSAPVGNYEESHVTNIIIAKDNGLPLKWAPASEDLATLKGTQYSLNGSFTKNQQYTLSISGQFNSGEFVGVWIGVDKFVGFLNNGLITFTAGDNYHDGTIVIKTLSGTGTITKITLVEGTMANYYYDKYNATIEINQGGIWKLPANLTGGTPSSPDGNVREILPTNPISLGTSISQNSALNNIAYISSFDNLSAFYIYVKKSGTWVGYGYSGMQWFNSTHLRTAKGTLVTSNIKLDDTYPVDGIHTDGFYYVRGAKAGLPIYTKVGTEFKMAENGYVNVGGSWKEITSIYQLQNGSWVQLF